MTTPTDNAVWAAAVRLQLVIPTPYLHVKRDYPTASWWSKHEIQPGAYPIAWVDRTGIWNSDLATPSPGFLANVGPTYGQITVDALTLERYTEDRLLWAVNGNWKDGGRQPEPLTFHPYPWELQALARTGAVTFLGGRIVEVP